MSLWVLLVFATALGPLAMSSFIPAIPAIQQSFDISSSVAQLTMSVSMISMAIFSLVYGTLADRYGRRIVLLCGVALAVFGSYLSAIAPSIEWAIVGRALQAAGATSGLVLARVVVKDIAGSAKTASILGYITSAMTIAPLIGPIVGGQLIDAFGWRSVFWSVGSVAAVLLVLLYFRLPETKPSQAASDGKAALIPLRIWFELLANNDVRRYLLFAALAQSTFMAFLAGAPYVVMTHFGLSASHYGTYFFAVPISFALGGLIAGKFGDRVGHGTLMVFGAFSAVIASLGSFILIYLPNFNTPWVLFLPAAFVAIAQGVGMPGANTAILKAAGKHAGNASGLASFMGLILGAIAAQCVGHWIGLSMGVVALAMCITSLSAFLVLFFSPTSKPN